MVAPLRRCVGEIKAMHNLLRDALIRVETGYGIEWLSLPGVLAALVADRIESFPALRAHQAPAWHMFLTQLGAIALHRAGRVEPPADVATWTEIIQALTHSDDHGEEPWQLVVADRARPAFMQPPVPNGVTLDRHCATPDKLDMLITSKNHEIKQAIALSAEADDWIFAIVSLQTCEGYGGLGNYGVARMNGGSSSRALVGLVPVGGTARAPGVRAGRRFTRDVRQLIVRRAALLETSPVHYCPATGSALLWTLSWRQGAQLSLSQLDPYFIEACRRVRLSRHGKTLNASVGTSSAARINAEAFKGAIGDPWAPVHALQNKTLTLGEDGEFNYQRVVSLMFSNDWTPPVLATLGPTEHSAATDWVLVFQAFARGNSKTNGFKERIVPLTGRAANSIGPHGQALHVLAQQQIDEIDRVSVILRGAITLAAAGGDTTKVSLRHRVRAQPAGQRLEAAVDRMFFDALWQRLAAEHSGQDAVAAARVHFVKQLVGIAQALLIEALDGLSCSAVQRPRATVSAVSRFSSALRYADLGLPESFFRRSGIPAIVETDADAA